MSMPCCWLKMRHNGPGIVLPAPKLEVTPDPSCQDWHPLQQRPHHAVALRPFSNLLSQSTLSPPSSTPSSPHAASVTTLISGERWGLWWWGAGVCGRGRIRFASGGRASAGTQLAGMPSSSSHPPLPFSFSSTCRHPFSNPSSATHFTQPNRVPLTLSLSLDSQVSQPRPSCLRLHPVISTRHPLLLECPTQ
jgi:hypothetical protein